MKVLVRKIAEAPGGLPAIPAHLHTDGTEQPEPFSLPIDYEAEGIIADASGLPHLGHSFIMRRTKRNGVVADGDFVSSPVTSISGNFFTTQNSLYYIEVLER